MCESGVEEADAVVSAALGAGQERAESTYWRLVRSVRHGGKVVQETVAQLGELDAEGRANARLLSQQITGANEQRELFEAAASAEQRIAVPLDRVCALVRRGMAGMEVVARAQAGTSCAQS